MMLKFDRHLQEKGGQGKSSLSDFKGVIRDFRSITGYAASTLPIVAAVIGIAPPWPPSVGPLTSILIVVCLAVTYQSFRGRTRRRTGAWIIATAAAALVSVILYLGLRDAFTFQMPTTREQIVIGCGYTQEALQVARQLHIEVGGGCPGQFQYLLATASFDNYRIWSSASLLAIKLMLLLSWLLFFFCITIAFGLFIVDTRGRRSVRAKKG